MREIVTLQLGNLSNYVATHFWNAQESYFTYSDSGTPLVEHDVHWRPGIAADGSDTFLPRTVIYDLKGGFGSLRKTNPLYDGGDDANAASLWSGPSKVQKQPALEPSAYQQSLNNGLKPAELTTSAVRYWSDFSRVYFHPKSVVQLYDFELNSTIRPFERFSMGTELLGTLDKEHDIVDRDWRPFVEECDRMQGIQVYTTLDDAWGGFAASYLEALRDEYPKACIWVWGLQSPVIDASREQRQLRMANTAQSLSEAASQSSMVLPLSVPEANVPPGLHLDSRSPWHVSALLAAASESASLPSRLSGTSDHRSASLDDMTDSLNTTGNRNIAATRMAVGSRTDSRIEENLDIDLSGIGRSTARDPRDSKRVYGQLSSRRGVADEATTEAGNEASEAASRPLVGQSILQSYSTSLEFPLLDSYPSSIFTDARGQDSLKIHTTLSTEKSIAVKVKALRSQITWSVGLDERENLSNSLAEIAEAYQDDWSSGSDEDDDDL